MAYGHLNIFQINNLLKWKQLLLKIMTPKMFETSPLMYQFSYYLSVTMEVYMVYVIIVVIDSLNIFAVAKLRSRYFTCIQYLS